MTRIVQAGWESGDIGQIGTSSVAGTATLTVVSATPSPRSGTYSLKGLRNNTNSNVTAENRILLGATKTEVYLAFALYTSTSGAEANPNCEFLRLFDAAGNVNMGFVCDAGVIRAYAFTGGTTNPTYATNGSLLGTGSINVASTTWTLIEIHLIASTTTGGTCEIKVNGASALSVSSVRTAQTTASYNEIGIGLRTFNSSSTRTDYHAIDDLRINDTSGSVNNSWPGDESIIVLTVSATGTSVGGGVTSSSGGAINTDVDDIPPNTTDYVTAAASGDGNTFGLTDPTGVASCSAVNVIAYMQNPSGGSNVYLRTKTGAGTSDGSSTAITTSWAYYNRLMETDPADSAAWSQAKLAALEAGMKAV